MVKNMKDTVLNITESNIKILVCCHKSSELPKGNIFLPIHVGASISEDNLNMQRDDTLDGRLCDNISDKNKSYCELTAMYWAWKNIKKLYPDIEYIGLNHYRRFFCFKASKIKTKYICKSADYFDLKKMYKYLKKKDWIVSTHGIFAHSLYVQYCVSHYSADLKLAKLAIESLCPDYIKAFDIVLNKNSKLYAYNMFIMPYEDFQDYCSWLFPILKYVEERSIFRYYDDVQKRVFGYLAERLQDVYMIANKKTYTECPVYYVDSAQRERIVRNPVKLEIKQCARKLKWFLFRK